MEIIDFGWLWRPLRAIVPKRCKIGRKLLLIANRKSHIVLQMTWKSFTLNDLEGQYCNRNCIGCSVASQARYLYCEIYLQNLHPIFSLLIHSVAVYITWRDDYVHGTVAILIARRNDHVRCLLYYHSLYFSRQRSVNIACMELSLISDNFTFYPWLEIRGWALDVGGTVGFS